MGWSIKIRGGWYEQGEGGGYEQVYEYWSHAALYIVPNMFGTQIFEVAGLKIVSSHPLIRLIGQIENCLYLPCYTDFIYIGDQVLWFSVTEMWNKI